MSNAQTKETNHAKDQAAAQLSSIRDMVTALDVDYDRLEELRDERESLQDEVNDTEGFDKSTAQGTLDAWDVDHSEELAELEAAAGDCTSRDDAEQRIQEDPLSVQVRSDWYSPGETQETPKAEEFEILLCTGGPAVRILGELDEHNQPDRARLEYQDWGTEWTQYYEADSTDALLAYCSQFYFGE